MSKKRLRHTITESSASTRRKVWLINPYGSLPGERWREHRFATIGQLLADRGCDVTWWTGGFSHQFKVHRSRGWKDISVGPRFWVRLVPTTGYRRHVGPGRLLFELVFAYRLYSGGSHDLNPPDIIITPDTPQVSAFAAARLAQHFKAKLLIDVMDLWPELFDIAIPPVLRAAFRPMFWPFRALRRFVRNQADAVTALCPSYLHHALVEARPGIESRVIYNGIDIASFQSELYSHQKSVDVLVGRSKEHGEIWGIFAGTMGNNYDIKCLVSAADILKNDSPPIHIITAGDGPLRRHITEAITGGLGNLHFLGRVEQSTLASLYRSSDVGVCAYAKDSNVGMPDKAYDYMASGLPIISSLRGDLQTLIETTGSGLLYKAGDPVSLADALRTLARDSALRKQLSANASACCMTFDRTVQYHEMIELFCGLGWLPLSARLPC